VFLLGAGATRGALPHVLLNRKRVKPPLNGDFFEVATTYARAHGPASAESRRLQRLRRVFNEDLPVRGMPMMEEAFSLLYLAGDFPEIYRQRRGRKPASGRRQEMDDFLRLAFGILTLLDKSTTVSTGYDRLATRLEKGDTIISLNYDTVLDSALWRHGWNPTSGYSLGGGGDKIRWRTRRDTSLGDALAIRLLKLHGSVNWFVRGNFSRLEAAFVKKPVRVTAPRSNEITGHIRQIVPPIYGKTFKHDHWRRLWDLAYHALCEAEVLVVIGCSLIDTDFHLRALVSRAAKWRKTQGSLFHSVVLVDTKLAVRRKWRRALRGTSTDYESVNGFDKFLMEER